MTYNKPGIAVLGDAARVIQSNPKSSMPYENPPTDTILVTVDPAYEVDE